MRNLKIAVLLLIGFSLFPPQNIIGQSQEYQEGWEEGHCQGWKDVKGRYAVCPVTPICPVPTINCPNGYRCGYNRGFKRGRKDAIEGRVSNRQIFETRGYRPNTRG